MTVDFATVDGTAVAGTDYGAVGGALTFAAGETVQFVTVTTTSDTLFEGTETFSLSLSNASAGTQITAPVATGTILDDDPPPTFQITGNTNAETGQLAFTITRTGDAQTRKS